MPTARGELPPPTELVERAERLRIAAQPQNFASLCDTYFLSSKVTETFALIVSLPKAIVSVLSPVPPLSTWMLYCDMLWERPPRFD